MRRAIVLVVLAAFSSLWAPSILSAEPGYRVIVNTKNPVRSASRDFLSKAFLKKVRQWPGGETIHPADLHPRSDTRRTFSRSVLKRSVAAVKSYWQQAIFSGRDVPPPELDSDRQAVLYVQRHRGGVAYVSESAELEDVKQLTVD